MISRRAILIQDIKTYQTIMFYSLHSLIPVRMRSEINKIFEWIIAEQIERVYLLPIKNHIRNHPYQVYRYKLIQVLPYDFDQLFAAYIKAPILYCSDEPAELSLRFNGDLYLHYHSQVAMPPMK